ncbi:Armadillo type fold [Echinococcus multilocularis]|uniref:Armadillo type fold n=1 Tax=Echinococcus multilocularis TaxID=6211 RepID=A0A068YC16_ECHMU|nr:Armadillo type fold [Echinococcus multilocularis]
MSCDPDVVQIIGSDNCVNYFVTALGLIMDELPNYSAKHFEQPAVSNFITLYAVLWNVTDKSCDVCNRFVLADAYITMWKLLSKKELSSAIYKYTNARLLVHCSLGILHNLLLYCPRARDDYRACGGVKILDPYVVDAYVSDDYDCNPLISVKTAALFTLAAIVNENENVSIITTDQGVLTYILSALRDSLQSPPDYYSTNYGYHAAEVFGCLSCLAGLESNKRSLFENNALELISTALQITLMVKNGSIKMVSKAATSSRDSYKFSEDTLAKEAIDLLWHLTCLPEARDQLKETSDLYKLCAQFNDVKWTSECRKSVQALFCTLSQQRNWLDECGNLDTSAITASPKPRGHVMISYNNMAQNLVSRLKEALSLRGWNVWIFTEHCQHGSFLEQMAEAVFDSAALILCLSSFYNNSCHCIKEVISAYEYRIPLLPVVVESDYVPINFLRFLLAGVQPIQLYNDYQVDDAADKLTEQLRCYGVMREGANVSQSRPRTGCVSRRNQPPSISIDAVKRHQRSRSDCLNGIFSNRQSSEPTQLSISSEASAPLTSMAGSPTSAYQCFSCQPKWHPSQAAAIPARLVLASSSTSPRGQQQESAYFFTSTPHIDTASASCSSAAITTVHLPAPLEAYLVEQIPSKAVRGWQEEQVRQWLAEHSLAHYAHAFACINGLQLYELAWQRIRGCDSFFRNLSFGMHMPLYEQLLLSSALAIPAITTVASVSWSFIPTCTHFAFFFYSMTLLSILYIINALIPS